MDAHLKPPPSPRKIQLTSYLIGFIIFVICLAAYFSDSQSLTDIEGRLLDARFRMRGPIAVTNQVVIVAVDDVSLETVGRWPWSRTVIADMIRAMNQQGAAVIALDIVFSEPERNLIMEQIEARKARDVNLYEQLLQGVDMRSADEVLAGTIMEFGNVVNGQFFYTSEKQIENLTPIPIDEESLLLASSAVTAIRARVEDFPARDAYGVETNIPLIAGVGLGAGYFNFPPGADGVIRKAPLVMRYHDQFYPSLALKGIVHYFGDAPLVVYAEEYGLTHLSVGGNKVKVDEGGSMVINYRGPRGTIPTYSAVDVLHGKAPAGALEGKLVLLGVTAIGVYDAHSTPFGPTFPGLEIQANVADNILADMISNLSLDDQSGISAETLAIMQHGRPLQRTNIDILLDLVTMFILVMVLVIVLPRLNTMLGRFIFSLALLLAYVVLNYYLFAHQQLWIILIYPVMAWFLSYLMLTLYFTVAVERSYSTVRSAFKSYLHPGLVDQLTRNPELLQFGGENKNITLLFSDIRSFTNLSENLTPQQLARFLNCYMDPMTAAVLDNNGTLDKYIGDAVMALFGAPYPTENHPLDACNTAIIMIEALDHVVDCCPELAHLFPIKIGVGVHTGEVVVGNLGSSFRFAYTALGDNVNLASRLEGLSKMYGVDIVVSEASYEQVQEHFDFRFLDLVRVKGKKVPIRIYELCCRKGERDNEAYLIRWQEAITAFQGHDFSTAKALLEESLEQHPNDKTCEEYITRCRHYLETPPPDDWDGVTTLTSK
ncbi:MAG: adenylate/guanylate cyclase domain-containing protein [Gammaproteobacteria bacterium]|nr:adenylate/guanylate cyclase domain-containing protein [Gammaproteobacteria bacterium]